MKLVSARLRDDVDDTAERATVFGLVAAGLDLDLLDELVVDGLALEAADDGGRVDTVNDPELLRRRGAVDRESQRPALCIALVLDDARIGPHNIRVISSDGQV